MGLAVSTSSQARITGAQTEATATAARGRSSGWPALAALIVVCCLFAAAYSVAAPAFEAPDEPGHYNYVDRLVSGQGLPLQGVNGQDPEFGQPPFYYAFESLIARLAPSQPDNVPVWDHHNPFQDRTDYGNVNLYYHRAEEAFPWTGTMLRLHAMRLANLVFLLLAVLATYGSARELRLPPALSWCAAAILGLIPQVLFISGVLNADNAIAGLSAAALYLLLRWLNHGSPWTETVLLGLVLGNAALAKLSGLSAVALAVGFMGLRWLQGRQLRALLQAGAVGVMVLCIAGWWYARNWILLGDPLGWEPMLAAVGQMLRPQPIGLLPALAQLFGRTSTALAVFGWTNVPVSPIAYFTFDALCLLGLAAAAVAAARQLMRRSLPQLAGSPAVLCHLLVLLWPVAFILSLARWIEVNAAADQWRLVLPAFPALTLLIVIGLQRLVRRWQALLVLPLGLVGLNVGALLLVLVPAYAFPAPYKGPIEHQAQVRFGDALELVGYSTPSPTGIHPGDTVSVDLVWRALRPMDLDYLVDLAAIDSHGVITWKELSTPDEGRAPTSQWTPGLTVRDRHRLIVQPPASGVHTLLLSIFVPVEGGPHLPAVGASDTPLANDTTEVGRFMLLPPRTTSPSVSDSLPFADNLTLAGHSFTQDGKSLRATLVWQARGPIGKDYTVFVHLLGPDDKLAAQHDSQPDGARYPTSLLPTGQLVPDTHVLDVSSLSPGRYQAEVGVYDLASGQRLPLASNPDETSHLFPVEIG